MTNKKIPLRMCVGCREKKSKAELIRIVKKPEGEIVTDTTGKISGRGAYICRCVDCLAKAEKTNALSRAFETKIDDEVFTALREALKQLEQ